MTKLNSKIIEAARTTGEPVRFSFIEGNRNAVSVGSERFYRVRPSTFHRDMRAAGLTFVRAVNPYYVA